MKGSVDAEGDRLGAVGLGSGALAISSSRWFCQKQSPQATTEHGRRDDDPVAQLVEMLDKGQLVLELAALTGPRLSSAGR